MKIYYQARNIYQYSYVKSLYREIGGDFIIHKPRTIIHLKKNFAGFPSKNPSKDIFGCQPKTRYKRYEKYDKLSGILISLNRFHFSRNPDKLIAICMKHGVGLRKERDRDQFPFDYYFIDGDLWLRKLMQYKELNIREDQIVRTGNLRFDDMVNGKLDRSKILKNFGVKYTSRPNILYAPTWQLRAGTLMKYSFSFIEELTKYYNLFIRPHYYDWRRMGSIRKFIKTGKYKNVYIVEPWNIRTKDTMENLFISDLLISDNSSISYQSLIFTMPVLQIDFDESNISQPPFELDIRKIVDCWSGKGSILPLVEKNLQENKYKSDLQSLLKKCFYFNDGKCTERAVSFLKNLSF